MKREAAGWKRNRSEPQKHTQAIVPKALGVWQFGLDFVPSMMLEREQKFPLPRPGRPLALSTHLCTHLRNMSERSVFFRVAGKETSFIHAPSHNTKLLDRQFATLHEAGAHGVMLDVWCAPTAIIDHQ